MNTPPIPQVSLEDYERHSLRLIHSAVDHWAELRPGDAAIINAATGAAISWRDLQRRSTAIAGALARLGFAKGDVLAASLPLLNEHIFLEYACFRLGVIHAPLDLRLQPAEVLRCLALLSPKGYAFPGKFAGVDFFALGEAARRHCASIEHAFQFAPAAERLPGAIGLAELCASAGSPPADANVSEFDPAQVIFTTGSTGSPKPALLSHRGITCQNLCLATAFRFGPGKRVLCNLPASHVGGQAEILMTSLFSGATAVTLEVFDPVKSLDAIERHGVTLVGQIPAMFQMEWRSADYPRRNLGSLEYAVYGGQAVPRPFMEQMLHMAPRIATGLGLTECSGFCTYTPLTSDVEAVAGGVGWAMPAYPVSIRQPMNADRSAGAELPPNDIGHVCFRGPPELRRLPQRRRGHGRGALLRWLALHRRHGQPRRIRAAPGGPRQVRIEARRLPGLPR